MSSEVVSWEPSHYHIRKEVLTTVVLPCLQGVPRPSVDAWTGWHQTPYTYWVFFHTLTGRLAVCMPQAKRWFTSREGGSGQPEISSYHSEQRAIKTLWVVYFWNFSCNIFELWLTTSTSESETVDKVGGTTILLCISENNFCPNFSFICSISGINSVLRWRLSHQNREFAETRTVYFCILSAWYIGGNFKSNSSGILFSSVQSLSRVQVFVTPWTAALQASLSITNSFSFLKLMSIKSVMPSNYLILCHFLLLLPSILPSIRVFSSEPVLHIRWPKYWSFSFSISPSNEYWTNLL